MKFCVLLKNKIKQKNIGICVIISVSTSPWMLHKKTSSCGQQSVASNIKSLSIKLLELITLKDKTIFPLLCTVNGFISAALFVASESRH